MIAIIGAMDTELEYLLRDFEQITSETIADKRFFIGNLCNKQVLIAKSGVGKVNAAMTTTAILANHDVEYVINIGVAGGIGDVKVGDIVLADGIAYFDVSLEDIDDIPFGKMGNDPLLVLSDRELKEKAIAVITREGFAWKSGNLVSGDRFVTNIDHVKKIMAVVDNVLACEMEGMAVGLCCHKFKVPFLSVRGISDIIDKTDQKQTYAASLQDVCETTTAFVKAFLRHS